MNQLPTRLFVGNLSTTTSDQDLQISFKDAGEIKSCAIVTRGRLSLGYGYIDFVNASSVEETIAKFKDLKIQDQQVQFEIAKDLSYQAFNSSVVRARGERRQFNPNEGNGADDSVPAPRRLNRNSNGRRNRNRNINTNDDGNTHNFNNITHNNNNNSNSNSNSSNNFNNQRVFSNTVGSTIQGGIQFSSNDGTNRIPRVRRNRNNSGNNNQGSNEQQHRPPREPREKIPSKTTLYVANLPQSYGDGALGALFKEFTPVTSRVVVARNGRPRGYGFVEFANEVDQLKALNSKNNLEVPDGDEIKTIAVSISHTAITPSTQ